MNLDAALLGWGIQNSLSPVLHQAAARSCGAAARYALVDVPPEALDAAFEALKTGGLHGFNVTAPYKGWVAERVDELSPTAHRLGMVNTVVVHRGGRLRGENTDTVGVQHVLGDGLLRHAVVLGAGGAAHAVVDHLTRLQVPRVEIVNRTVRKARALAARLAPGARAVSLDQFAECLVDADLLVCAVPPHAVVQLGAVPFHRLAPAARVVDLNYGAAAQPWLSAVRAAGRDAVDGVEMLVWQGVEAYRLWTGALPDVAQVRKAVRKGASGSRIH